MREQMSPERKVLHIDLDAYYSSVEQRDNPALRGRPVVVGGDPYGRGVVATASYEARSFGIHSTQPCREALRLCPYAVFLRPRFAVYQEISRQILALYRQQTPLAEPVSLDEAYLDFTSRAASLEEAVQIARELKRDIYAQTGLTASAGISSNKFLSKLASDHQKPNGLTVITPDTAMAFISALPIGNIHGVGQVSEARLRELGVATGRDLLELSMEQLQHLFGKRGTLLYQFVRGQDDRAVEPERERKSVGCETTFARDLRDREEMLAVLESLAEQVAIRLAELGIAGKTITLKLRWNDFRLVSRSLSTPQPIQGGHTMMQYVRPLLDQLLKELRPVRLLGISLSHLVSEAEMRKHEQIQTPSLWEEM